MREERRHLGRGPIGAILAATVLALATSIAACGGRQGASAGGGDGSARAVPDAAAEASTSDGDAAVDAIDEVDASLVVSIGVSPADGTTFPGEWIPLVAFAYYVNSPGVNVTAEATWRSDDPSVARVDSSGIATGVSPGTTIVHAALGSVEGTMVLTVKIPDLLSVAVTPPDPTFNLLCTSSVQLKATATYSDRQTDVTDVAMWSSTNSSVASVDAQTAFVTEGTQTGMVRIIANFSGFTGQAMILVDPLMPAMLAVTPPQASLAPGDTAALSARVTLVDSSSCDATGRVVWQSSSPGVATVSAGGVVTAVDAGSATVSATLLTVTGAAQIDVQ